MPHKAGGMPAGKVESAGLPTPQSKKMRREHTDSINGFTLALRDGEPVDFRPVALGDRQAIQNGIAEMSQQSRYFRFFSSISKLSEAQLRYFTAVDHHDHVAWIALRHEKDQSTGLGIARFIRDPEQPSVAEFAVSVIDRYQRRGLGTLLMAVLHAQAARHGIEILRGFVLPENTVTCRWLARLGAAGGFENGVYRLDLAVNADLAVLPATSSLHYFRDCLVKIQALATPKPV